MSVNVMNANNSKSIVKKKIVFKGKNVYYKTIPSLAKKLKIDKETAKQLVEDFKSGNTFKYIENEGDIIKYDYTTKPLFLRDFGIKKVENKYLLNDKKIKGIDIASNVSISAPLNLTIVANLEIKLSSETIYRKTTFQDFVASSSIDNGYILSNPDVQSYLNSFGVLVYEVNVISFIIQSSFTEQKFDFNDMELYDTPNNLKIDSLFNEVLDNKNWKDCVYDFMTSQYKKLSKKKMKELRTINDIHQWSINNSIKMLCYDINGKIIQSNYPDKKSKMKNLVFIAYNNHLYPLKNNTLSKVKINVNLDLKFVEENKGLDTLLSFIKKGILPTNIYFQDDICKSFTIDNKVKYVDNIEYDVCSKILNNLGLIDKITPLTNLKSIGEIIEPIYLKENINSFIPKNNKFIKGGFNYTNDIEFDNNDINTIDKNKAYSFSLSSLSYLIKTDIRTMNITYEEFEPTKKIIPHYLYVAEPKQNSILMESNNLYTGEHLLYCKKEGVEFKIIETLQTEKTPNYYKEMVNDLYEKLDQKQFKTIINILIGKMERCNERRITQKVIKVCNEDEADRTEGLFKRINDKYHILFENNVKYDIYNRKPISLQIKEHSRITLYEMCKKLKLNEKNVVQIKTDSISFCNGSDETQFKKYINKDLTGWKTEIYSPIKEYVPINNNVSLKYEHNNNNILANCYAGAGKTHTILNNLIPKLEEKKLDYIILTPSHSTLREYRKANVPCSVIQKYTLGDIIPFEDTIIIDEIGMVDKMGWDLIYKMYLGGKKIYAYGDFKQLKSIDGHIYNKKEFLDLIFGIQLDIDTNYRNNFTQDYYDDLINEKKQEKLVKEMKEKRHKDYKTSHTIICYRNNTKDKYNALMAKHLGINSITSIGAKVICISNKYKKLDIFNKFTFEVIDNKKDNIIISDGYLNYEIPENEFEDNFNFSYARTLYSVQGETLPNFFYPNEDLYFIDGRTTYTLISRLKQKLEKQQNARNDKCVVYDYNKIQKKQDKIVEEFIIPKSIILDNTQNNTINTIDNSVDNTPYNPKYEGWLKETTTPIDNDNTIIKTNNDITMYF